jgi:hypothetical protein
LVDTVDPWVVDKDPSKVLSVLTGRVDPKGALTIDGWQEQFVRFSSGPEVISDD